MDDTHPQEAFMLGLGGGERRVFERVSVLIVNMELTRSDNMSKVLDFVGEPGSLLGIESDTGFAQPR